MANADLQPGALAKPVKGTMKRLKASLKRQDFATNALVYAAVDARDLYRCRACSEYAGVMVHRHHLRGRKFTTLADVCHLCEDCHGFLHVRVGGKLLRLEGNADQRNSQGVLDGLTLHMRQNDGTWRTETGF